MVHFNASLDGIPTTPAARPPRPTDPPADLRETPIVYNPQDETVMGPETIALKLGKGGVAEKAELSEPIEQKGGGFVYDPADSRYHAAVSLAAVARTIDVFEKALGRPIRWAFDGARLGIKADAGEDFNAYYAREDKDLNFFHGKDPVTKQTIYSADSGEVVSHETGHAILDGLRPGYFQAWSPDPAAFHESFGDVMGMMVSLQDDAVVDRVAQQTGGDLSKPNVLADTGEQLGAAINHVTHKNTTGGDYVRTAINDFVWKDPSTLPEVGGPKELGSEAHSFSRLWTGAVYDVLKGMVDENRAAGQDAKQALRGAGDELLKMYANLFKTAPQGDFTYRDMALALLKAENRYDNGKHSDLIAKVFTARGILQPGDADRASTTDAPPAQTEGTIFQSLQEATRPVKVALNGPQYGMFNGAVVETPVDKDGALTKDAEVTQRTRDNLQRLIQAGRIKYADPGQKLTHKDLFDAKGRPYFGVVRWVDGQMTIDRVKIAN